MQHFDALMGRQPAVTVFERCSSARQHRIDAGPLGIGQLVDDGAIVRLLHDQTARFGHEIRSRCVQRRQTRSASSSLRARVLSL